MKPPYMSTKDVAKYLGIHEMTVYRMAKDKKIPAVKVGGKWKVNKELLDQWLLKDLKV